ncbi:MAG: hypothetical protein JYX80_02890 [Candidatus Scalindua sediminis]|nr:hypothetical protein [Candidatus Scalindua sediminis]
MYCTKSKGRKYNQEYYPPFDYFIGDFGEAGMHEDVSGRIDDSIIS